jgi:hypothetical protein
VGQRGPGKPERGNHIYFDRLGPGFRVNLPACPEGPGDSGIVYYNIDRAKLLFDLPGQFFNASHVCQVKGVTPGGAARILYPGGYPVKFGLASRHQGYFQALPGQFERDCLTNPASGPGYKGHFWAILRHLIFLLELYIDWI